MRNLEAGAASYFFLTIGVPQFVLKDWATNDHAPMHKGINIDGVHFEFDPVGAVIAEDEALYARKNTTITEHLKNTAGHFAPTAACSPDVLRRLSDAENYSANHPVPLRDLHNVAATRRKAHADPMLYLQQFGRIVRAEDRAAVQLAIVDAVVELVKYSGDTLYQRGVRAQIKHQLAKELRDARCTDITATISRVVQGVKNV